MPAPAVLVAHRGYPQCYPENSLIGIKAALELGAKAIEIDVQASADGQPMVCHDVHLKRVAGIRAEIGQLNAAELTQLSVHEPKRFGSRFEPCYMPQLQQVVELVSQYPGVTLFVELKKEIFARFERSDFVRAVLPLLTPLQERVLIISFDLPCLRLVQNQHAAAVGWVIQHYTQKTLSQLQQRPVDVVICDWRKLPPGSETLWSGPWRWFIYDIVTAESAHQWQQRGVHYIESWDIKTLIQACGDTV